ncbi:hypothetical protein DPEC_G00036970 [Dallia pectoralis]|uniref:Uncharacterized protein n=1 Tax=Dallia pectoralis TaxID=75939 RepID=A0ACC2HEG1_DALPE|nr:hypothetical protein DPEC_G00036970 [Dallia pectoralis]
MKRPAAFVSLIVVVVTLHGGAHGWDAPSFCRGFECPEYTVVFQNDDFEERAYNASRWMTIDIASDSESDLKSGFTSLWHYTQGDNQARETLNTRTWPALISTTGPMNGGQGSVSVSFLAAANNAILPTPNEPIRAETQPASTIYVRSFSDNPSIFVVQTNLNMLRNSLALAGRTFNFNRFSVAAYESPWSLIGRHDEIWIYAV